MCNMLCYLFLFVNTRLYCMYAPWYPILILTTRHVHFLMLAFYVFVGAFSLAVVMSSKLAASFSNNPFYTQTMQHLKRKHAPSVPIVVDTVLEGNVNFESNGPPTRTYSPSNYSNSNHPTGKPSNSYEPFDTPSNIFLQVSK